VQKQVNDRVCGNKLDAVAITLHRSTNSTILKPLRTYTLTEYEVAGKSGCRFNRSKFGRSPPSCKLT